MLNCAVLRNWVHSQRNGSGWANGPFQFLFRILQALKGHTRLAEGVYLADWVHRGGNLCLMVPASQKGKCNSVSVRHNR